MPLDPHVPPAGLIAFSLYGDNPKYWVGAVRNQELVGAIYPGFSTRFYVGETVPRAVLNDLERLGAQVVPRKTSETSAAMFWRFEALTDRAYDVVLVRDTDSRINRREAAAVQEWIASGMALHIMRDHPWHDSPIMGGLFGIRPRLMPADWNVPVAFDTWRRYGDDQLHIAETLYKPLRRSRLVHDSFFSRERDARLFPELREGLSFVGESFDEHEQPDPIHRQALARTLRNPLRRMYLKLRSLARSTLPTRAPSPAS
jgi:hypothetical protein